MMSADAATLLPPSAPLAPPGKARPPLRFLCTTPHLPSPAQQEAQQAMALVHHWLGLWPQLLASWRLEPQSPLPFTPSVWASQPKPPQWLTPTPLTTLLQATLAPFEGHPHWEGLTLQTQWNAPAQQHLLQALLGPKPAKHRPPAFAPTGLEHCLLKDALMQLLQALQGLLLHPQEAALTLWPDEYAPPRHWVHVAVLLKPLNADLSDAISPPIAQCHVAVPVALLPHKAPVLHPPSPHPAAQPLPWQEWPDGSLLSYTPQGEPIASATAQVVVGHTQLPLGQLPLLEVGDVLYLEHSSTQALQVQCPASTPQPLPLAPKAWAGLRQAPAP
jgi:hypothetical protein